MKSPFQIAHLSTKRSLAPSSPHPAGFSGDACALTVFDEVIAPAALRFAPDLILVSAGYDAHWRDPFQQLQFRSATYHSLATRLKALAAQLCSKFLVI